MAQTFKQPFTNKRVLIGDGDFDLVGAREIEDRHGLTRGQVHRLFLAGDLPEPVAILHLGRVWDAEEVARRIGELKIAGRIGKRGELNPWRNIKRAEEV